jgi:hypothetical protein
MMIMASGLVSATAVAAQDRSYDWSNPPPPPPGYDNSHWFSGARHCSLDQRDYAYINECGELIPSIWDPFPGRG